MTNKRTVAVEVIIWVDVDDNGDDTAADGWDKVKALLEKKLGREVNYKLRDSEDVTE